MGLLTSPGGGFAGVFAKTHFTRDCGKTWTQTNSPYNVKVMPPLILPSGAILETGGVFGDKGTYGSNDGGKTWTKYSSEVSFSEVVWSLPRSGLIGVSRGQFGIENIQHSATKAAPGERNCRASTGLCSRRRSAQAEIALGPLANAGLTLPRLRPACVRTRAGPVASLHMDTGLYAAEVWACKSGLTKASPRRDA